MHGVEVVDHFSRTNAIYTTCLFLTAVLAFTIFTIWLVRWMRQEMRDQREAIRKDMELLKIALLKEIQIPPIGEMFLDERFAEMRAEFRELTIKVDHMDQELRELKEKMGHH